MEINGKKFEIYLLHAEIEERTSMLAEEISNDYGLLDPILLGVLNGSYIFFAELSKKMVFEVELYFTKYQCYDGTENSGKFEVPLRIPEEVKGRDVIVVEDIVDTGRTLERILSDLTDLGVKSVEVATLLMKPDVFKNRFPVKYVGFEIPNKFIVGYGLDYNQRGRNLLDLHVLAE